jgi:putative acetyltransferase
MVISDYDAALDLWKRTEGIGLSEADSRPHIETYLSRNPGLSSVALDGAELVGGVLCGHDGRRGFIHHLAVSPDRRHEGIGSALVERCFKGMAGMGLRKCHIFVFADNAEGKKFWRVTGWRERFDLTVMSRDVRE